MKIRSGFVSNSSSSSFVIITTKEKWAEAKVKLSEEVGENVAKVVLAAYGEPEKAKILGQDALVFQGVISSEDFGWDAINELQEAGKITEDESECIAEDAYCSLGTLNAILNKDGISYAGGESC